jgi:hypothetical protein
MKNKPVLLATAMLALLIILYQGKPLRAVNQDKPKTTASTSIPDSINKIFNHSCVSCHSSGGNVMAQTKLNFNKWDRYKAKKKASKAEDICRMLVKEKMPPKSVRESKPETIPTKAQIKSVCLWAVSLKQKK